MAMGPILIFDKSTLQSLNADEACWLENFFLSNIAPLFFIETLADLEKEVEKGRTPEQVVGNLAYKTPVMGSFPNVHHAHLLEAELLGAEEIKMDDRRPIIAGGSPVALGEERGIHFEQSPEAEAFARWQRGEFLEVERRIARLWRKQLADLDHEENLRLVLAAIGTRKLPKTLEAAKDFADELIGEGNQEELLQLAMKLLDVSPEIQTRAATRWHGTGMPPLRDFAPYLAYLLTVEVFFYISVSQSFIARQRPSNKVDIAYLYYLPFCMVFTSGDRLHARCVPLFLGEDQTFVNASDLKSDLADLDAHYATLPEEVKEEGIMRFAPYPPTDVQSLVSELWDKHLPGWRELAVRPAEKRGESMDKRALEEMRRVEEEAVPLDPSFPLTADEADHVLFRRSVPAKRGKWRLVPPEVERDG